MVLNLRERDYKVLGGLIGVFILGGLIRLALIPWLPIATGHLIILGEIVAVLVLMYSIRRSRRWKGELSRLLDILSLAAVVLLIMQTVSAIVHIISNPPFFGIRVWDEAISAGNILGILIAAYGFYEFSNAPWFNER